ncbi:MAG: C25 family peptidase propeptide domain-containing protein, partial [Bacteroidota bacterium]|nr:C25 family peptidase propeptide domain-containing protein [Bacteroidota bacterium]
MNSKFSINYIIIFCVFTSFIFAQQNDVKIISSNANSLVFEYFPSFSDSSYTKINNDNYFSALIKSGFVSENIQSGMPAIPERIINTAVPSEFGNTLEIVKASYKEFPAKLLPVPYLKTENGIATPYYQLSENYNNYKPDEDIVTFSQFGIARGIPVQSLKLMPVKYFPQLGVVRFYYDIVVKVTFKSGNKNYLMPKDEFAKDVVINYDAIKYWATPVSKSLNKTATNSVLSSGKWVRFEAPVEGIYKIAKSDLAAYGLDANVDPRTIKIYNNSGKMLSESVEKVVPTDLVEVAIYISGESDGVFNDDDYILFYGRGTNFWEYNSAGKKLQRSANYYSNQNYFWITSGGVPGKRMETKNSAEGGSGFVQTTTKAMTYLEDEKINICKSSRDFLGDEFNLNTKSRVYTNKLDGLVPSSTIQYNFRFVNTDYDNTELVIEENQTKLLDTYIAGRKTSGDNAIYVGGYSLQGSLNYSSQLTDNRSNLKFFYNANNVSSKGYLDFFEISYNKYLTAFNDELLFFSKDTSSLIEYDLNGFSNSNIRVFDISDYSAPKIVSPLLISGGEFKFKSNEAVNASSKYFALGNNNFKSPSNATSMTNQNLHGISEGGKVIIVTNKLFIDQANKY